MQSVAMGFLHLRDSRTKKRVRLENFDLSENVEVLRKRASELTGLDVNEQRRLSRRRFSMCS